MSEVLVDGCLFEGCYAKKKGGGASQLNGNMSVLGSVFYGNVAGGENIENGEHMDEWRILLGRYGDSGGSDGDHDVEGGVMFPPSPGHEDINIPPDT